MEHGTQSTYTTKKCRCDLCRTANREYGRKYAAKNRERMRELSRLSYARNREDRCAKRRARYKANPEPIRTANRQSAAKTRAKKNADSRAHYAANRERIRARNRKWAASPAGRLSLAARNQARRARLQNAPGTATETQIKARLDYYGGLCWMCGVEADCIDHVIPLMLGGSNWPANLRPACRSCNARKGANHPISLSA